MTQEVSFLHCLLLHLIFMPPWKKEESGRSSVAISLKLVAHLFISYFHLPEYIEKLFSLHVFPWCTTGESTELPSLLACP